MNNTSAYNVFISGDIISGFESSQVEKSITQVFRLSPEKARALLGQQRVVKRAVDLDKAQEYKTKLEKMGLVAGLEQIEIMHSAVNTSMTAQALSLLTTDGDDKADKADEAEAADQRDMITCPKCKTQQVKSKQCIHCGVFFHKIPSSDNTTSTAAGITTPVQVQQSNNSHAHKPAQVGMNGFNIKALIAASIAAVLGALLWKFIAVAFNYEYGFVAWIIGGAVGYAAMLFDSRGQTAGVICAVMVLCAIFGGKYLATASFQAEWQSAISDISQEQRIELRQVYKEQKTIASDYAKIEDAGTLRAFMLANGYTDASTTAEISEAEINDFEDYSAPVLLDLEQGKLDFDQWLSAMFDARLGDYSTVDLVLENLGLIDIVFLILGMATAFRLGSAE